MSASSQLKRYAALALAGGSLALGVPAALAATGGDESSPASAPDAPAFIQDSQDGQARPDREDCPEKGNGGSEGEAPASADATPEPSV